MSRAKKNERKNKDRIASCNRYISNLRKLSYSQARDHEINKLERVRSIIQADMSKLRAKCARPPRIRTGRGSGGSRRFPIWAIIIIIMIVLFIVGVGGSAIYEYAKKNKV